jgi:hypothetical protein
MANENTTPLLPPFHVNESHYTIINYDGMDDDNNTNTNNYNHDNSNNNDNNYDKRNDDNNRNNNLNELTDNDINLSKTDEATLSGIKHDRIFFEHDYRQLLDYYYEKVYSVVVTSRICCCVTIFITFQAYFMFLVIALFYGWFMLAYPCDVLLLKYFYPRWIDSIIVDQETETYLRSNGIGHVQPRLRNTYKLRPHGGEIFIP